MAAASPLSPVSDLVRVIDDPERVKEIARKAEALAAMGVRGKELLHAFGLEDDGPSVTITTMEELERVFSPEDGCAPSS